MLINVSWVYHDLFFILGSSKLMSSWLVGGLPKGYLLPECMSKYVPNIVLSRLISKCIAT